MFWLLDRYSYCLVVYLNLNMSNKPTGKEQGGKVIQHQLRSLGHFELVKKKKKKHTRKMPYRLSPRDRSIVTDEMAHQ